MQMRLTLSGKLVKFMKAARFYKNGSSYGFVWRFWHPLSWILAPIMFILNGLNEGFPSTWKYRHDIGFRIDPWFRLSNKQIEWVDG